MDAHSRIPLGYGSQSALAENCEKTHSSERCLDKKMLPILVKGHVRLTQPGIRLKIVQGDKKKQGFRTHFHKLRHFLNRLPYPLFSLFMEIL